VTEKKKREGVTVSTRDSDEHMLVEGKNKDHNLVTRGGGRRE